MDEFDKLEKLLISNSIVYEREDRTYTEYMYFFYHQLRSQKTCGGAYIWDVIYATGSYGREKGLLELYGTDMEEPIGWLTAEQCLEIIIRKEQEND